MTCRIGSIRRRSISWSGNSNRNSSGGGGCFWPRMRQESHHGVRRRQSMRSGKGWALETFRKRQEAPRGTVPFLIKWIVDLLKTEPVEEVSLCLLLWKGTHTYVGKRRCLLLDWGLRIGYHLAICSTTPKG